MAIDWLKVIKNERVLENNVVYGSVAEPWQLSMDEALIKHDHVYAELPRGHDKTGRLACHALCWLLEGEGKIGYAAGVDKDNAKLFRDEMKQQSLRNKKFFANIQFYNYVVMNVSNNNILNILASDAPSNIGLKFNLLLVNDFVEWKNREFFEILMSATGKLPHTKIWVESNAGRVKRDYKWTFREYARTSEDWFFKTTKKWLPSWTPSSFFEEQRAILSPASYRRLIENEWIEEADTFLTVDQVSAITSGAMPPRFRTDDMEMVATATDLGLSEAATCIATLGSYAGDKPIRLLDMHVLPGSKENPPQISDVESIIGDQIKRYGSNAVIIDPWNMRKTMQDRAWEWPIQEFTFSPANIMHLTSDVFRRVVNKQLQIYPSSGPAVQLNETWDLQRELCTAIIRQMSYGERIDKKKSGFIDRIVSVGMALSWLGQNAMPKVPRNFDIKII